MPSYIELDKNVSVPASSDVSKLILSLNILGQLVVTDNNGNTSLITASPTYPNINMTGNYTISGGGIYEIASHSSGELIFPDPSTLTGQTITVINSTSSSSIPINNNTFEPYDKGSNSQITSITTADQYQFVAIGNKWRGGKFS
jgi:hypothetical protein